MGSVDPLIDSFIHSISVECVPAVSRLIVRRSLCSGFPTFYWLGRRDAEVLEYGVRREGS